MDLVGIGIGPFNLSLAALLEKVPRCRSIFLERKPGFDWHPEVMFADSTMQTGFLKDLVTPVDPTSAHSFLNYLVQNKRFYAFINTQRSVVSRREFEQYCSWVSKNLGERLKFNTEVRGVSFDKGLFQIESSAGTTQSQNICVATGLAPRIPDFASPHLGPNVFHAKSPQLQKINLEGKSVAIIGGGQTGVEIFRNALLGKWGRVSEINLITRRKSLEPLDESPFTNEYFTPAYVDAFWDLTLEKKMNVVASQKLASDGNTPSYLNDLYNDLYRIKHVEGDLRPIRILASRRVTALEKQGSIFRLELENSFLELSEAMRADIVILCTGFESAVPKVLEPLYPRLVFDDKGRFKFKKTYSIEWDGPSQNRIYALNFSRHNHGIMDPQTSLMAWRSAVVVNDLMREKIYEVQSSVPNFVEYTTPLPVLTETL